MLTTPAAGRGGTCGGPCAAAQAKAGLKELQARTQLQAPKGTKLHFKSPKAERRHVLCVVVGRDRTHAAPVRAGNARLDHLATLDSRYTPGTGWQASSTCTSEDWDLCGGTGGGPGPTNIAEGRSNPARMDVICILMDQYYSTTACSALSLSGPHLLRQECGLATAERDCGVSVDCHGKAGLGRRQ